MGSYILAGELSAARGDHRLSPARYERRMRPYATRCRAGGHQVGEFLAPRTRTVIDARHAPLNKPVACARVPGGGRRVSEGTARPDHSRRTAESPSEGATHPGFGRELTECRI
ncbi:hypothetical protein GCM10017688_29800 [Streptomyces ramulosus]